VQTLRSLPYVLVVDDDEGLSLLMVESLREKGLKAEGILSGKRALEFLKSHRPDLMLLDLGLKDLSGQALLEQLEEEKITVPFIVVTGQGDERVAVEMMKQGALDYLIKDTGMLERLPLVVKRAAEKLESKRALAAAQSALLESEKEILAVSEAERQRIGADLHDNLGQQLTAIELLCHSLREQLQTQPELEKQMGQICRYLQESVSQTRLLARGLTPVSLNAEGLADSLAEMTRRMSNGPVQCEFVCTSPVEVRGICVASHLFRIAQEAVNNAIKHGEARKIVVTLSQDGGTVVLKITDDGHGFPESEKPSSGIGLQIMQHRANVIGATLETQSLPGKGVTVSCTLRRRE
jgi:signal transduction histidine kinase